MPKTPTAPEFLAEDQAQRIADFEAVSARLDGIIQGTESPHNLVPVGLALSSQTAGIQDINREESRLAARARTMEDVTELLRVGTLRFLMSDLHFETLGKAVAIQTGLAQAEGDPADIARGYDLGLQVVRRRAVHVVGNLISVTNLFMDRGSGVGGQEALWDHAKRIYANNRKLMPPVQILPEEGEVFDELQRRKKAFHEQPQENVPMPFKIGKSRALNLLRAGKFAVGEVRKARDAGQTQIEMLQAIYERSYNTTPPFEITDEELGGGLATADKMERYLRRAGLVDRCIGQDPRMACFSYLMTRTAGGNLAAEREKFGRSVNLVAKYETTEDTDTAE